MAFLFKIISRRKTDPIGISKKEDFELDSGTTVSPSVICERSYSPYSIDLKRQTVSFVKLDANIDLSKSAFVYMAQYDSAQELVELTHNELLEVPIQTFSKNIIFIYSTPRSGSTLLSKIFEPIPNCYSLSEPDAFPNFLDGNIEFSGQLNNVLKLLLLHYFKWPTGEEPYFVVKFRSLCTALAPKLQEIFSNSIPLFSYRNPVSEIVSRFKTFVLVKRELTESELYEIAHFFLTRWATSIDLYLNFVSQNMKIFAVHHETLLAEPLEVVRQLLTTTHIPKLNNVDHAVKAIERRSQAGTVLEKRSQEKWDQEAAFRKILSGYFSDSNIDPNQLFLPQTISCRSSSKEDLSLLISFVKKWKESGYRRPTFFYLK